MDELTFDDPINIQYTSGTTGFPKGATLSHHNILNNGFFVAELLGYGPEDRVCLPVPFDHPDFGAYHLAPLRTGIMAGSPCPAEVMKRVQDEMHMAEVAICYGMTETSPVSTQTCKDDTFERRVGTVGRAGPHVEVKIVDPGTGLVVPRDQPGEFCTRGSSVMLDYWDEPEKTREAIDAAGWMHTGDLATMDADGYSRIVGRIKAWSSGAARWASPTPSTARSCAHGSSCARGPRRRRRRSASSAADSSPTSRSPLRRVHRRVPDDRHRQGPEVQDARGVDRAARPRRARPRGDRLTITLGKSRSSA
jgi:acyl-CoA synthetase (AMP-forming)/AMP-acid ligase II